MRTSSTVGFLTGTVIASALVGGAAWAASPTPAPSSTAPAAASTAPSRTPTRADGHRRAPLAARASHGQFTVTTKKGDRTVLVQRGTVSAVTQPSGTTPGRVTVVSVDRFSATYALPSATKVRVAPVKGTTTPAATTTLKVGERVRLVARAGSHGGLASLRGVRVLPDRAAGSGAAGAAAGS